MSVLVRPVIVAVPIDSLGRPGGTELAPVALRAAGIVDALGAIDASDLDVRIVGPVAICRPASSVIRRFSRRSAVFGMVWHRISLQGATPSYSVALVP